MKDEMGRQLSGEIKRVGRELGFDLVGIAPARPSAFREYLRQWLAGGQGGTMEWLERRFEERTDPGVYLPGARSVICVAMNYFVPLEGEGGNDEGGRMKDEERTPHPGPLPEYGERGQEKGGDNAQHSTPNVQRSTGEDAGGGVLRGRVARYALGDDYHEVMKGKLHEMADWLRGAVPGAQTRAAVDTGPVMEKELAQLAGVGWVGKNTCLINERIGSWLLLGEVLTTVELPADDPGVDRCGTCRRCIEACPTQAITGPYQLDARRCISYLTIEHRGEIAAELEGGIGDWLYGCDICQEVCPWNGRAPVAGMEEVRPRFTSGALDVREVMGWGAEEYREKLKGSAMKRVKLPMLQRNASIVERNLRGRVR